MKNFILIAFMACALQLMAAAPSADGVRYFSKTVDSAALPAKFAKPIDAGAVAGHPYSRVTYGQNNEITSYTSYTQTGHEILSVFYTYENGKVVESHAHYPAANAVLIRRYDSAGKVTFEEKRKLSDIQ